MFNFRDGLAYFRNSGVKGLKRRVCDVTCEKGAYFIYAMTIVEYIAEQIPAGT